MNHPDEQRQHERLCAYLFGELEGEERAAFEAELAASPELQEERARLESTIAIVHEAIPAEEILSASARAELSTAASGNGEASALAPVLPWPTRMVRSPFVSAAAVLILLGGLGALGLKQGGLHEFTNLGESTARLDGVDEQAQDYEASRDQLGRESGEKDSMPERASKATDKNVDADGRVAERQVDLDNLDVNGFGAGAGSPQFDSSTLGKGLAGESKAEAERDNKVAFDQNEEANRGESLSFEARSGIDLLVAPSDSPGASGSTLLPEEAAKEGALGKFDALGYTGWRVDNTVTTPESESLRHENWIRTVEDILAVEDSADVKLMRARGAGAGAGAIDTATGTPVTVADPAFELRDLLLNELGEDDSGGPASPAVQELILRAQPVGGQPPGPGTPGPSTPGPAAPGSAAPTAGLESSLGLYSRRLAEAPAESPPSAGFFYDDTNGPDADFAGAVSQVFGRPLGDVDTETFGVVFSDLGEVLAPVGGVANEARDDESDVARGRRKKTAYGELKGGEGGGGALEDEDRYFLGGRTVVRGFELVPAADRARYSDEIVSFCRIRPQETPSMMFFRCWGDNPVELAQLDPLSTFAADVDTASYALARNYLNRNLMPTKAQIRTEEFVNYFDSGVAAPASDVFSIKMDMAPSLFGKNGEWMMRVVVAGKKIDKFERQNLALTFVVDTSGSMKEENRMELVKHSLRLLVGEMFPNDAIAIVAFSSEARLILPMTSASNKGIIESAIYGLNADGSTNADAGLRMGYEVAGAGLTPNANNRVILLSDGVANVGNTEESPILASVEHQRSKGIYLNTIGVGMGNHNDALLEQLANKGDGICNYIDTQKEAYRALVENFTGAFQPIARDVKIQVEFDPAQVQGYRLLGYENRTVADAQFRDDKVDAGEIGAGHQVTALYELTRMPTATNDGPLATARVRFKRPFAVDEGKMDLESAQEAEKAREIEQSFEFQQVSTSFQGTTPGYQRAVLVAQLAEVLRRSVYARADSFDQLLLEAIRLERILQDPDFTEFCTLLAKKSDLIERHLPLDDDIGQAIDELTRHNYLKGQLEQLHKEAKDLSDEVLEQMQRQNKELENRIRELIIKQLEASGR